MSSNEGSVGTYQISKSKLKKENKKKTIDNLK